MTTRSMIGVLAAATLAAAPCTLAQDKPRSASEPAPRPTPAARPRSASEPAPAPKPAAKPAEKPANAAMPMPRPAPEMARLKMFDGSWSCTGDMPATPMGPAMKTRSSVRSHTAMNGFWQAGTVTMSAPGMSMEGMFHITYDPGQKQYVLLWMDNTGGYS